MDSNKAFNIIHIYDLLICWNDATDPKPVVTKTEQINVGKENVKPKPNVLLNKIEINSNFQSYGGARGDIVERANLGQTQS